MSRIQCYGSIARAAVVIALLSSRPAEAQVVVQPGPPGPPPGSWHNLGTGVHYDIMNEALAEHRLANLQAKLRRDAERGNSAAADRDVRLIERVRFRIVVDEWLIRKNSLEDPGVYPYPVCLDPISSAAIAQYNGPPQVPVLPWPAPTPGPTPAAPTVPITIVNAGPAGAVVAFTVDGVVHQSAGGSRQNLAVASGSSITYDGGGSLGQRRYRISPGLYEFRSTAEGWALYKLPDTP